MNTRPSMSQYVISQFNSRFNLKYLFNTFTTKYNAIKSGYWHDFPQGLFIDVSSYCNLSCRMCPYLKTHEHPMHMTIDTFINLFSIIKIIPHICFVGNGEPLMNKHLITFMKMALEINPTLTIDLTTNGTLLTTSLCNEFININLNKIVFSIDGPNAETVESIRSGVNFSRVIENVHLLHELKKEKQTHFPIIVANHVVAYGNYAYLPDFVRLADQIGINEIQFLELQSASFDDFRDNFLNSMLKDGGKILREVIELSKRKGIRVDLPIMHENTCHDLCVPRISEEGEVSACCYYVNDRELYSDGKIVRFPTLSFGNVNKHGFKFIWNSRRYRELRRSCSTGQFNKFCSACYKARIETSIKIKEVLEKTDFEYH
jgi:sulfatase maturation enzyme AslB (radical SAM superfamily)